MRLTIARTGDRLDVAIHGRLDVSNRRQLKSVVLDELERGARRVRLDLAETEYTDSSGLGVLVSLSRSIRELGGDLRLANLNEEVQTLFSLTKLDTIFRIDGGADEERAPRVMRLRPPPSAPGLGAPGDELPDAINPS